MSSPIPPYEAPEPDFSNGLDLQTADSSTIKKYVAYLFQGYTDARIQDERLWECIHFDLEHFTKEHFDKFDSLTWTIIKDCCYPGGFWLDHNYGPGRSRTAIMLNAVKATEWYREWTPDQIQYVEDNYNTLSRRILRRKHQLMDIILPQHQDTIRPQQAAPQPPQHVLYRPGQAQYGPGQAPFQSDQAPYRPIQPPQTPYEAVQIPYEAAALSKVRFSKELTLLDKIYKEEDKFSGTGDHFEHKCLIYYDKCGRVGLPQNAYIHGASIMLSGQAQSHYYANGGSASTWEEFRTKMQLFFEGPEWKRLNLAKWQTANLNDVIAANPTLSTSECLRKLVTELNTLQRGIDPVYHGTVHLRENVIRACRGHPALATGLAYPPADTSGLINNLYTSIVNYEAIHKPMQQTYNQSYGDNDEHFFTDRQYRKGGFDTGRGQPYGKFGNSLSRTEVQRRKKCFVCSKEGCWSTRHTQPERDASKKRFANLHPNFKNRPSYDHRLQQWIVHCEGEEEDFDDVDQFFKELSIDIPDDQDPTGITDPDTTELFHTSYGKFQDNESADAISLLANNAFNHRITAKDNIATVKRTDPQPYNFNMATESRYDSTEFKGLLIDSGAAVRSTGGIGQLKALQQIDSFVQLDKTIAGSVNFTFGIGNASAIGTVNLDTPLGKIIFYIVAVNTPFLLCLADMDRLGAFFNNVSNKVIQNKSSHSIVRRYGHAFLLWNTSAYSIATESFGQNPCFLTDVELRRLHRRFGHPSVRRLRQVLQRSGHEIELRTIEHLTKYCEHCQKYGRSPGRFSFTIKDDIEFNYNIIVDILYLQSKPVLHIVDEATRFQTGRWLKDVSAKHVWDQLRSCWIDTYLGPPDLISSDAGKQFTAREFKQYAANMGIIVKTVPVEAHHSIGLVERYHGPLRRVYMIIITEIPEIEPELALQMSFKALNDSAGPNGLVPTLLVFGSYPRMSEMDAPSPTISQRTIAIRKAMDEVRRTVASRQVNDALNTRNGPSTTLIHDLPLNSQVLVFREGNTGQAGSWKGPYKLLDLQNESAIVQLSSGPTKFRATSVKPYYDPETDRMATDQDMNNANLPDIPPYDEPGQPLPTQDIPYDPVAPAEDVPVPVRRGRGRPRKHPVNVNLSDICFVSNLNSFVIDSQPQFTTSRQKEIAGLLEKGVFQIIAKQDVPYDARIFNARFVDEIKNPGTDKAFEKSRLVVQAYNDQNKDLVLTQSPTIQRVSQRLIVCLATMMQNDRTRLYLRDVTQAYVQSTSNLNRDFYVRPPYELATILGLDPTTILRVVKPLYGVPEAGNHWFATYHRHHVERLGMDQSTYDPCFLYKSEPFGIIGLQTDDTLILAEDTFATSEETAIKSANISTKDRDELTEAKPIKFNGTKIVLNSDGTIGLTQGAHVCGISTVRPSDTSTTSSRGIVRTGLSPKEQYVAQRARGAYLASICQPEASFDLSYAAQSTKFSPEDIKALNKRLQWQMDNPDRGLKYIKLDRTTLRLVVFSDSSFANNWDLSSQIGFVICLADSTNNANIIHWSSVKCKRVTRSVLAAELYGMAYGFDVGATIKATLSKIFRTNIPLILCTDSKSLYDCLVKLGTTQEKRLMIDVMSLRQSYERREITEIKWIYGQNNPADSMTKSKASSALKTVIDSNQINLDTTAWVERTMAVGDGIESTI